MTKLLRVAWHEYTRHVLRRRFVLVLFSLPILVVVMGVVMLLLLNIENDRSPVGLLDRSGVWSRLSPAALNPPASSIRLQAYTDETLAARDLHAGLIQAYYVFESDYLQTGQARAVALEQLSRPAQNQVESRLRAALLAGQDQAILRRIAQGSRLAVTNLDGSRRIAGAEFFNLFLPVAGLLLFFFATFITSGYLMQAMAEERENRTLEILVSSLSPSQLLAGKTFGILGVGATQLAFWVILAFAAFWIISSRLPLFQGFSISPGLLALMLAVLIPAFLIIASVMAAIGALVNDFNEGQQISGPFSLPFFIPFWFLLSIIQHPDSTLAVTLSLVPFTAPATLILRASLASVPSWQIALSLTILFLTSLLALWLAGRAFRLGMLSYGRNFDWRQFFARPG